MDRYIGRLLDNRYEILEVIGIGGMAVVYKARCHRLNRLVAIKILKDEYTQDEEFRNRFHAESQAVAMLSHPNIVSVYDVSTSDDADFIVMELIDGISLKQYMEKKGVLNWKETLHFAIQIAKALDHAHSRGIIHRDIKPHNVMVLKNGSVKVADFGIARVMSKSNTLTKEALGSVHYISPEQAKGGRVDNRSDLYSLGAVMYEMMTGRPPYDGESPVAVAIQHINGKPQMPSTLNPNIPGGLEQIIMKTMDQDPGKRYLSAQSMLYDMDEFRKDPSILFDYHTAAGMEDAPLITREAPPVAPPPVRNTAERVASRSGETGRMRSADQPVKPRANPNPRPRRRQEEIVEEKEKGGKVATIAIAVCSVVALITIIVCVVMFFQSGGVDSTKNEIPMANLINSYFDDVKNTTDYVVEVEKWMYSADYEKGKIIDQNPKANVVINRGSKVLVVVSAGPEPAVKVMENLVGLKLENAKSFLISTQGVAEERVFVIEEANSQIPAGQVIRTEPSDGADLPAGDDPIRLYVSSGPSVKTATLPDFTSEFYTVEKAQDWFDDMGFTNVTFLEEINEAPKGRIFYQSVEPGVSVEVTKALLLRVSLGKNSTEAPPNNEKPEPDDYVYRRITVELPEDKLKDYTIAIYRTQVEDNEITQVLMEEREIPVGSVSTEFYVSGKGKMTFVITIDGEMLGTMEVDFDAPEDTTQTTTVQDTPNEE